MQSLDLQTFKKINQAPVSEYNAADAQVHSPQNVYIAMAGGYMWLVCYM